MKQITTVVMKQITTVVMKQITTVVMKQLYISCTVNELDVPPLDSLPLVILLQNHHCGHVYMLKPQNDKSNQTLKLIFSTEVCPKHLEISGKKVQKDLWAIFAQSKIYQPPSMNLTTQVLINTIYKYVSMKE